MRLTFLCPLDFEQADTICTQIRKYLPNLVDEVQIIRTNAQPRGLMSWEILPYVEKIAQPNWERDIVLAVIIARVCRADMELTAAGAGFDLLAQRGGRDMPSSGNPKIGAYYLPRNMPAVAAADIGYWVNVGVGELLHYFAIPEEHDGECFYDPRNRRDFMSEDNHKDFCQTCIDFMHQLTAPIDFEHSQTVVSKAYSLDCAGDPSANESGISASSYASSRLKRILDLGLSVPGIILSGMLLPFVSLAIWINSPGPIFYRQVRIGLGGRPFVLTKLRTMRLDAETNGNPVWGQDEDPRVTAVGRVLRRLYVDELPQLWNIIRGDMSFIGPRPERPVWAGIMKEEVPGFWLRTKVLPGVTGWAQVNYKYVTCIEEARIRQVYDIEYVQNSSLAMDLRILGGTLLRILRMKGEGATSSFDKVKAISK